MSSKISTEARSTDFTNAYQIALNRWQKQQPPSLTVRVTDPVSDSTEIPKQRPATLNVWYPVLKLGDKYSTIESISLGKTSPKTGGDTVGDWVEDRIAEQFTGMYWNRSGKAVEDTIDKLNNGYPGNTRNALIANLFQERDRQRALRAPLVSGLPCVSHLQFIPNAGTLHLCLTLRSQFIGLKGLGNLVAGGALLAHVANHTDHEVGEVREEVHNVTTHDDGTDATHLLRTLRGARKD
jgi:hypothetical protein